MKIISIISQKGGTGKTTLTTNLATLAQQEGFNVAILDLDTQGSSLIWYKKRKQKKSTLLVHSIHAIALEDSKNLLEKHKIDLLFIDTAPHTQNDALIAANNSDIIIIPCKASLIDLTAIRTSIDISKLANKKAIGILTMTLATSNISNQALKVLKDYNIELSPINIGQRISFINAFTYGMGITELYPSSKGSYEIKTLFKFLKDKIDV